MKYEVVDLATGHTWKLILEEPRLGEYLFIERHYFKIKYIVKTPEGENGEYYAPVLYGDLVVADAIQRADAMKSTPIFLAPEPDGDDTEEEERKEESHGR